MKKIYLYTAFIFLVTKALCYGDMKLTSNQIHQTDFFLTTRDSVQLDCSTFIPITKKPKAGWNVWILCHGYGDSKADLMKSGLAQAKFGYYVFVYSMRGQGKSGGLSKLISRTEMQDLFDVVDHIRNDTLANKDRIVIFGGSQGGIIPFMAACNGLPVRTVISDFASPEFASSWIENGCIKMSLVWTVTYDSTTARYDPEVLKIQDWIFSSDTTDWDSLSTALPRDRDFTDKIGSLTVPMLFENAWQDDFFNTLGMIKATDHLKNPCRFYFGALDGHGADADSAESDFSSSFMSSWTDYWIDDIANKVIDSVKYNYATSHYPENKTSWTFSHLSSPTWPPQGTAPLTLYFHPDGTLGTAVNSGTKDTMVLHNEVIDTSMTMQEAVDYSFTGAEFNTKFKKHEIVFTSDPLTQDVTMAGTPVVKAHYSSTASQAQLDFQIWETTPTNTEHLVTRVDFTEHRCIPQAEHTVAIEGLSHAHTFKAGNRIRIKCTNLDTRTGDSFFQTNPYVLPVLLAGYNTIYMGSDNPTRIDIPVVSGGTGVVFRESMSKQQVAFNNKKVKYIPMISLTTSRASFGTNAFDLRGRVLTTSTSMLKGRKRPASGLWIVRQNK